jgi:REP element-mobilizing transposase RayT
MPRSLRVFVDGGIYHVYNRFASGEPVFADPEEALNFVDLLRYVKQRDGWTVFAWALMSNQYHLAIRSRAVPISRGFHYLQGRFSQRFNRSRKRTSALWQSRYHAKSINQQDYLDRVILYIHLNPVAGGLVDRPADLVSRSRKHNVVEARRMVVTLGRERWGQSTNGLAFALQKSADTVTYIQREGIRERLEDQMFLRRYEDLDAGLIDCGQ